MQKSLLDCSECYHMVPADLRIGRQVVQPHWEDMERDRLADVRRFGLSEAANGAMVATIAASAQVLPPGSPAPVIARTLPNGLTTVGANQMSGRPRAVRPVRQARGTVGRDVWCRRARARGAGCRVLARAEHLRDRPTRPSSRGDAGRAVDLSNPGPRSRTSGAGVTTESLSEQHLPRDTPHDL